MLSTNTIKFSTFAVVVLVVGAIATGCWFSDAPTLAMHRFSYAVQGEFKVTQAPTAVEGAESGCMLKVAELSKNVPFTAIMTPCEGANAEVREGERVDVRVIITSDRIFAIAQAR